jgi:hypothetical protein
MDGKGRRPSGATGRSWNWSDCLGRPIYTGRRCDVRRCEACCDRHFRAYASECGRISNSWRRDCGCGCGWNGDLLSLNVCVCAFPLGLILGTRTDRLSVLFGKPRVCGYPLQAQSQSPEKVSVTVHIEILHTVALKSDISWFKECDAVSDGHVL